MSAPLVRPSTVAAALGVSVRSVTGWCADGAIDGAERTPGGHWRIPRAFIERKAAKPEKPEHTP